MSEEQERETERFYDLDSLRISKEEPRTFSRLLASYMTSGGKKALFSTTPEHLIWLTTEREREAGQLLRRAPGLPQRRSRTGNAEVSTNERGDVRNVTRIKTSQSLLCEAILCQFAHIAALRRGQSSGLGAEATYDACRSMKLAEFR